MSEKNLTDDERRLAELGYKQELDRSWSSFSNFAISFSIISILAGCFTTFAQAWNNGGPIAISIGWPVISAFILIIGFTMSELASAYPTSGGIYWWASKLGGAKAGFYTGWLNLIGLLAVVASVAYGTATFLNILIDSFSDTYATTFLGGDYLLQQFFWFIVILVFVTLVNIYSGHLLALINNVSVWWHVFGAAIVILIMVFTPESHQSLSWIFTERINNSGFGDGSYWFYVLPLGFLLTQYTITGFDASAHLAEETHGAHLAAARGIWQSIAYSAVGGWILLLSFLFAATKTDVINSFDPAVNPYGGGSVITIFWTALTPAMFKVVMFIATAGQVFCTTACLTSSSRMMFAFSRDGAVPGSRRLAKVNKHRVPVNGVMASASRRAHHHPAGALQEPDRCTDCVLRSRLGGGYRSVPRVRHSDLAALASPRPLRRGRVDERHEVQVDEPDCCRRDRHHLGLLRAPLHAHWRPRQRGLHLDLRELRTDPHDWHVDLPRDLVADVGEELVHRSQAQRLIHGKRRAITERWSPFVRPATVSP